MDADVDVGQRPTQVDGRPEWAMGRTQPAASIDVAQTFQILQGLRVERLAPTAVVALRGSQVGFQPLPQLGCLFGVVLWFLGGDL